MSARARLVRCCWPAEIVGGIAVEDVGDLQQLGDLLHLRLDLGARLPLAQQREADVLAHPERRIERVALEGHGDVAARGRQVVDDALADADLAVGHALEARDHAQRAGLAAAGGAQQADDLAIGDRHVDVVDRADRVRAVGP